MLSGQCMISSSLAKHFFHIEKDEKCFSLHQSTIVSERKKKKKKEEAFFPFINVMSINSCLSLVV